MALNDYADDLKEVDNLVEEMLLRPDFLTEPYEPLDFWTPTTRQAEEDVNIRDVGRLDTSARELNTRLFADLLFEVEGRTTDMEHYLQKTQRESQNELALFDRQYTAHHAQLIYPSLEYLAAFSSEQRLSRILTIMRHHARALGGRLREIADFARRLDHLSTRVTHLFPISATYAERLKRFRSLEESVSDVIARQNRAMQTVRHGVEIVRSHLFSIAQRHPEFFPSNVINCFDNHPFPPVPVAASANQGPTNNDSNSRSDSSERGGQMSESGASETSPYYSASDSDAGSSGRPSLSPSGGTETTSIVINGSSPEAPDKSAKRKKRARKQGKSGKIKKRRRTDSFDAFALNPPTPRPKSGKGKGKLKIASSAPSSPSSRSESATIPDVASNEEPYDSEPGLDHLPLVYEPVHVLEQSNIESTLNNFVGCVEVSRQIHSPLPADIDRLVNAMIDMAHVIVERGLRVANAMARLEGQQFNQEVPRIRQALERLINKSAAEPTPAPAPQGKLCGGRMSDGSSCETHVMLVFSAMKGYMWMTPLTPFVMEQVSRRGSTHVAATTGDAAKCINPTIIGTITRRATRCLTAHLPLVWSHTVRSKSGGERSKSRGRADDEKEEKLYLRGPQCPTRLTYDRRRDRWANITRFLAAVDDQGPDGPPDNHPIDDAQTPDSPPAGGTAEMIDV
ncbi:hypothetical protein AeMF1_005232 [Aphanomyces euteiches]|nr:hypothetical protein AeMF1_005232 [Aphanomyces euteiches]KAH9183841.1 hypothetical protein AeNC1_014183 [Aphanomyces euteiches]